ncbi:MAG TPA: hypothetical protein VL128_09285 [Candidatus Eisenbacteria bacterium]|nr:hypothetical protein [Candidatus Eisenbacteria bacterium]
MEILVFAGVPVLLLLLLMLLGATWNLGVEEFDDIKEGAPLQGWARRDASSCVRRIFSSDDQKYVDKFGSSRLRQVYRAERTRVAMYWVRCISGEVRQVMLGHRVAAAAKHNLKIRRELGLIFRYLEFRLLCGLLLFAIRVFGPHAMGSVADRALRVSEGIGRVLEESMGASKFQALGNAGEA